MSQIVETRFVLAVQKLKTSTDYYMNVLGFERDPIDVEGWSFLTKDRCRLMLGECPDATPARELGDHSYFAYIQVSAAASLYEDVRSRGAEILQELTDKPWGMREFVVRTVDGHRIVFGQDIE